jgi:hypothetical protein
VAFPLENSDRESGEPGEHVGMIYEFGWILSSPTLDHDLHFFFYYTLFLVSILTACTHCKDVLRVCVCVCVCVCV